MKTTSPILALVAAFLGWSNSVSADPVILTQPQDQTVVVGSNAIFSVDATGSPPVSYQWRRYTNATAFGDIPGATGATLLLTNVQPTSVRFAVVVSDAVTSIVSQVARLIVLTPLVITQQPKDVLAEVGTRLDNGVLVIGTGPLTFRWFRDGTLLPEQVTSGLVFASLQLSNAGNYSVVVSNLVNVTTSRVAAVTVVPARSRFDVTSATILRRALGARTGVEVRWPTTPGKTYDVLTTESLGRAWMATNARPIMASSSVASFTEPAEQNMRLYRIREQGWAPVNTSPITSATLVETEKILGLTFTPDQRSQILTVLNDSAQSVNRTTYEAMRTFRLGNSDPPALIFRPTPPGFALETIQRPLSWSPPRNSSAPTNLLDLAFASVRDLGEWIRTRQVTSTALTELCLNRLKLYDRDLLCVITLTETLALRQAARADAEIAAGHYRGPLHGIPYGLKDLFSTRDYRTTWGATPYKDQVIDEDATVVSKLEEAGAVLVAKLSSGSLASGDIWFGGQTRNPWDVSSGSRGSSAGSAAATAAGLVPFAIGTETWGSIMLPSTRCRVTGLRSTFGRVSRTGVMSFSWCMDKIGPICRNVEDCALVFEAIRGADGKDDAAVDAPFNYDPAPDVSKLRIGLRSGLPSEVTNRLAAIFGSSQLVNITLPNYPYDGMAFILIFVDGAAAFDELIRFDPGGLLDPLDNDGWLNYFRTARMVPAVEYLQAHRLRRKLLAEMGDLMRTVDVFVATEVDWAALAIGNLTGQPCAVIPNGSGASLSFIGRPYDEATVLAAAKAYQQATTFHTGRPPLFAR